MVWFIEGDGKNIRIGVEDSGNSYILGNADSHEPNAAGGDFDAQFYRRLKSADCSWSIHPSTEGELHIDGLGTGFYKRVQENLGNGLASIGLLSDPDLIGITIVVPPITFDKLLDLFRCALLDKNIQYLISLDFLGFKVPEAKTETPSIREFEAGSLHGKEYISEEVSFQIRHKEANA